MERRDRGGANRGTLGSARLRMQTTRSPGCLRKRCRRRRLASKQGGRSGPTNTSPRRSRRSRRKKRPGCATENSSAAGESPCTSLDGIRTTRSRSCCCTAGRRRSGERTQGRHTDTPYRRASCNRHRPRNTHLGRAEVNMRAADKGRLHIKATHSLRYFRKGYRRRTGVSRLAARIGLTSTLATRSHRSSRTRNPGHRAGSSSAPGIGRSRRRGTRSRCCWCNGYRPCTGASTPAAGSYLPMLRRRRRTRATRSRRPIRTLLLGCTRGRN